MPGVLKDFLRAQALGQGDFARGIRSGIASAERDRIMDRRQEEQLSKEERDEDRLNRLRSILRAQQVSDRGTARGQQLSDRAEARKNQLSDTAEARKFSSGQLDKKIGSSEKIAGVRQEAARQKEARMQADRDRRFLQGADPINEAIRAQLDPGTAKFLQQERQRIINQHGSLAAAPPEVREKFLAEVKAAAAQAQAKPQQPQPQAQPQPAGVPATLPNITPRTPAQAGLQSLDKSLEGGLVREDEEGRTIFSPALRQAFPLLGVAGMIDDLRRLDEVFGKADEALGTTSAFPPVAMADFTNKSLRDRRQGRIQEAQAAANRPDPELEGLQLESSVETIKSPEEQLKDAPRLAETMGQGTTVGGGLSQHRFDVLEVLRELKRSGEDPETLRRISEELIRDPDSPNKLKTMSGPHRGDMSKLLPAIRAAQPPERERAVRGSGFNPSEEAFGKELRALLNSGSSPEQRQIIQEAVQAFDNPDVAIEDVKAFLLENGIDMDGQQAGFFTP